MYFAFKEILFLIKSIPKLFRNTFITKDKEGKTGIERGFETAGDLMRGCLYLIVALIALGIVVVVIIAIIKWAFGIVF
jgi:hypothetical protein